MLAQLAWIRKTLLTHGSMKRLLPLLLFFFVSVSANAQITVEWLSDTLYQGDSLHFPHFIVRGMAPNQRVQWQARIAAPNAQPCGAYGFTNGAFAVAQTPSIWSAPRNGDTLIFETSMASTLQWPEGRKDVVLTFIDTPAVSAGQFDTAILFRQAIYFKRNRPLPPPIHRFTPSVVREGEDVQIEVVSTSPVELVYRGGSYLGLQNANDRGRILDSTGLLYGHSASFEMEAMQATGRYSGVFPYDGRYRPLRAGVYDVLVGTGDSPCGYFPNGLTVLPADTSVPATGKIEGTVWADRNSNCGADLADLAVPRAVIRAENVAAQRTYVALTDNTGQYSLRVPPGTYQVSLVMRGDKLARTCTGPQTVVVTSSGVVTMNPFLDTLRGTDLSVYVSYGCFRPGKRSVVGVFLNNSSDFETHSRSFIDIDTLLEFDTSTPLPSSVDSVVGHRVYFKDQVLAPATSTTLNVIMRTPADGALIGRDLRFTARRIGPADLNPANDTASALSFVRGSFDPNDKQVSPESRRPGVEGDLTYTIRFQNTGTDTAFYVAVRDTLSPLLDLSTLHGFASTHNAEYKLTGRVLEARFPFINLADSNRNEPASHGQFSFKIRPVAGLALGQQIKNKADIYFDYNAPVQTNTAVFRVQQPTALVAAKHEVLQWVPNPATSQTKLFVGMSSDGGLLQASSSTGSTVSLPYTFSGGYLTAQVADLAPGLYVFRLRGKSVGRVLIVR